VKVLGCVLFLATISGAVTVDPFSNYLKQVKEHKSSPAFSEFARQCGLRPSELRPIYGVSVGGRWERSADLAKAIYDTDSDFFSSAEVWVQGKSPRAVVFWSLSLDVGSEVRTMVCLDGNSKLRDMRVTNWSIPVDGGQGGWTHEQFETFDKTGKVISKRGYFVDSHGMHTAKPKLDQEDEGSFEWAPDPTVISKIQSDLLRHNTQPGTR
jgi:hypothetical protein